MGSPAAAPAPQEEEQEEEEAPMDANDMLSSLALKVAQLETSTAEINDDSFGLLEELEAERAEFALSRERAQHSIDQFRDLESTETQAAVEQLSELSFGDVGEGGEDAALRELQLKQVQMERRLGQMMHMRSMVAQQIEQLQSP